MSLFMRSAGKTLWENKKALAVVVAIVLLIIILIYSYFQFKRSWNYTLGYESRVQDTVCEMVKLEHMTPEGRKHCD